MKLVTVAEMQQVEKQADAAGLTYAQMMENAGQNLGLYVWKTYGAGGVNGALGLVGSGNNGGDTLVCLAYLASQGWSTCAYIARPRPENDPLVGRLLSLGGTIIDSEQDKPTDRYPLLKRVISEYPILLDGVLGTGARLPLKPEIAAILDIPRKYISEIKSPPVVVAVDCPSGVDCDTGQHAPEAIPAQITVTMAAVKRGLLAFPAFPLVGNIQVVEIGPLNNLNLPAWNAIMNHVAEQELITRILPKRALDSHKGTFGAAVIIAGSENYTGAVLLAGEAAYRIGAGWVTLAVPEFLHPILAGHLLEATWVLLPHQEGVIAREAALVIKNNLERCTALLIGPGFGLRAATQQFLEDFIDNIDKFPPMVVDADGLKLLARIPNWYTRLPALTILTPHPGEMCELTGLSLEEIKADRLNVAVRFARLWGKIVVLKGAFTIIASPEGETYTIPVATPALARAGTGDVLAGIIVGLLAQGVNSFHAAVAGAWIHAQAGISASKMVGSTASVIAGDVLSSIKSVIADIVHK